MSQIREVIDQVYREFESIDHDTALIVCMERYAELYATKTLKIAANNAIMSSNLREDSNLANIWINRESIINTKLPEHI